MPTLADAHISSLGGLWFHLAFIAIHTLENLLDIRYAGYCSVAHKAANRDLQQNCGVFLFRNTINRKYPKNLLKRKMFKCREDHNS